MVLEKTLEKPLAAKRSHHSILKEINSEYSLEWLLLKLRFQYFGQLMWAPDSLEKTLMLGKTEGKRSGVTEDETARWHHQLSGHEFEQTPGDGEEQRKLVCPWDLSHMLHMRS